jgi:hypothetical protein
MTTRQQRVSSTVQQMLGDTHGSVPGAVAAMLTNRARHGASADHAAIWGPRDDLT